MKKIILTFLPLMISSFVFAQEMTVTKINDTTFQETKTVKLLPTTLKNKQSQCDNIQNQIDTLQIRKEVCEKSISDAEALGIKDTILMSVVSTDIKGN